VRASFLVVAVVLLVAGCGGSSHKAAPKLKSAPPALAKRLLTKQLNAKQLDYKWVACVAIGRSYKHVAITRCNVDFGIDPHVEGYCVLLKDGRLATNHQDPAIPCKHDDAGWDKTTVITS
jgi:hypothetical protein